MDYLLHKDVYMPQNIIDKVISLESNFGDYTFSKHLKERLEANRIGINDRKHEYTENSIIQAINIMKKEPQKPFEVLINDSDEVKKFCVRISIAKNKDMILVIIPKKFSFSKTDFIKTAYLNNVDDNHITLNTDKYYSKR